MHQTRRGPERWGRHARLPVLLGSAVVAVPLWAALPPPTPQQQAEAAAKAAQAASAAAQEKQELAASMDRVAQRWRQRAAAQGWKVNAPTPVAVAATAAGGSGLAQVPGQGNPHSAPGTPAAGAASTPALPIRSEKLGTAPPSQDVKQPKTPQAR